MNTEMAVSACSRTAEGGEHEGTNSSGSADTGEERGERTGEHQVGAPLFSGLAFL